MNEADFLNHVRDTMDKSTQPWRFETGVITRSEPVINAYFFSIIIETLNSKQQATILWSSIDGWDVASLPEFEPFAIWLRDRLEGHQRDDAGNMHPKQPLTLGPDETTLLADYLLERPEPE